MSTIRWLPERVITQSNEMFAPAFTETFPGWVDIEAYPELAPFTTETKESS